MMGEATEIAWTDATFNPWWGCQRVSPGCEHCYAEAQAKRYGHAVWGPEATTPRRFFGDKHWNEPAKWNAAAVKAGVRRRVFCASMADVFENRADLGPWRERLWDLIEATPMLDWQLLTKRPENIRRMLRQEWLDAPRANVWLGTTCEDQKRADERLPHLLDTPAVIRFISCEPLLGPVDLSRYLKCAACKGTGTVYERHEYCEEPLGCQDCRGGQDRIDWVIVGGESGGGSRRFEIEWARTIVRHCRAASVAVFVKQVGAFVVDRNDVGFEAEQSTPTDPRAWPTPSRVEHDIDGHRDEYQGAPVRVRLTERKGGDMAEWPAELRVREFPTAREPLPRHCAPAPATVVDERDIPF